MSNDKKSPPADNAFFTADAKGFADLADPNITSHEPPHADLQTRRGNAFWDDKEMVFGDGMPISASHYDLHNLYWDGKGFRGGGDDYIIDGSLTPVHIYTGERELHDALYQAGADAVFYCANHALVAQGQHLAKVWDKKGAEFRLVPERMRIPEPPTYADIRKD